MKRMLFISAAFALALPSCAANRFVISGFPAPDRAWTGADYAAVGNVLRSGGMHLPTLDDADGAEMFERIVDPDNFALIRNTSLPIATRFNDYLALMTGFQHILVSYVTAANERGERVHTELARLMVLSLRLGSEGIHLVNEFIPTIPHDHTFDVRMNGLTRMRSGIATTLNGAEKSLGERGFYSASDLSLLLAGIRENLSTILTVLTENHRIELRQSFRRRLHDFTSTSDLQALNEMIRLIDDFEQRVESTDQK